LNGQIGMQYAFHTVMKNRTYAQLRKIDTALFQHRAERGRFYDATDPYLWEADVFGGREGNRINSELAAFCVI